MCFDPEWGCVTFTVLGSASARGVSYLLCIGIDKDCQTFKSIVSQKTQLLHLSPLAHVRKNE